MYNDVGRRESSTYDCDLIGLRNKGALQKWFKVWYLCVRRKLHLASISEYVRLRSVDKLKKIAFGWWVIALWKQWRLRMAVKRLVSKRCKSVLWFSFFAWHITFKKSYLMRTHQEEELRSLTAPFRKLQHCAAERGSGRHRVLTTNLYRKWAQIARYILIGGNLLRIGNKKKMQSFLLRWWWNTAADSAAKCLQRIIRGVRVRRSHLGMKVLALVNWFRPLIPLYKALRRKALVRKALKSLERHRISCEEERRREQNQQLQSRMLLRLRTACQVKKREYDVQKMGVYFVLDKLQRNGIALLSAAAVKARSLRYAVSYFNRRVLKGALNRFKRKDDDRIQNGDMRVAVAVTKYPALKEPNNLSSRFKTISEKEESHSLLQYQLQNYQNQKPFQKKSFQMYHGQQKPTHNGPSSLQSHINMMTIEKAFSNDSKRDNITGEKSASTISIDRKIPNADVVDSLGDEYDNQLKDGNFLTCSRNSVNMMKNKETVKEISPDASDSLHLKEIIGSRVVKGIRRENRRDMTHAMKPFTLKDLTPIRGGRLLRKALYSLVTYCESRYFNNLVLEWCSKHWASPYLHQFIRYFKRRVARRLNFRQGKEGWNRRVVTRALQWWSCFKSISTAKRKSKYAKMLQVYAAPATKQWRRVAYNALTQRALCVQSRAVHRGWRASLFFNTMRLHTILTTAAKLDSNRADTHVMEFLKRKAMRHFLWNLQRRRDFSQRLKTFASAAFSPSFPHISDGSYACSIKKDFIFSDRISLLVCHFVNAGRMIHHWQTVVKARGVRSRKVFGEMLQENRNKQRQVLVILKHDSTVGKALWGARNKLVCVQRLKIKARDFLKALQMSLSSRGSDSVVDRLIIISDLNRWRAKRVLKFMLLGCREREFMRRVEEQSARTFMLRTLSDCLISWRYIFVTPRQRLKKVKGLVEKNRVSSALRGWVVLITQRLKHRCVVYEQRVRTMMDLAMRIMHAWRSYTKEKGVTRSRKECLLRLKQSNVCLLAFKAWKISLVALRENNLEMMVNRLVCRNAMRVGMRNMNNAARASAHHIEVMKISCLSKWRPYMRYRRVLYQLNRKSIKHYFLPLVRKSILLLRMLVRWRAIRDLRALSLKVPCQNLKLHIALRRWHRVASRSGQYRFKMNLMIRREERRIKGGSHWGGGSDTPAMAGSSWKASRVVCGQLTGRSIGGKVVQVTRLMNSDNKTPTKARCNLDPFDEDVDNSDKYKDNEGEYKGNAESWMMMINGKRRRMDTLSLGGIRLISTASPSPCLSTSTPADAHWDGAVAVDKYKDNKWVTLKAMARYATTVKMRRAVVRWSRRRLILLKCYPMWKALAHHQRFTRDAFLSRVAMFLRRESMQFIWNKIKTYARDSKFIRVISKKNALCIQKQVISHWTSLLAYTQRARSSLIPLMVWAGKISVRFSFYYWRISVSNAIGLNNLALMKSSVKIWKNMASASRCYNRNLAKRVLLALRRLLWVRGEMGRALKRSRGIALLLATRLDHIGKLAIKRSFGIWVMKLGMDLGQMKSRESVLKPFLSSSLSLQGSMQHPNRNLQGDDGRSESLQSLSKGDKSSCVKIRTGSESERVRDLLSVTASSIKQTSSPSSSFMDRSNRIEAFGMVPYPLYPSSSQSVSKDHVGKDSYGRYMDRIKDEDIEEDSEDEEEEEERILNSSLSLRYTALIRSKQSLIVH